MWRTINNLCLKYIDIYKYIQSLLQHSSIHFDFENSAHNAVGHFFPNCYYFTDSNKVKIDS